MTDTCVSRVPVFASLSAQDQQRVEGLARSTHLRAGETAYSAHDDLSQLMVLHKGHLTIFRLSRRVRAAHPGAGARRIHR